MTISYPATRLLSTLTLFLITLAPSAAQPVANPNYEIFPGPEQISHDVSALGGDEARYYKKFIDYIAPNGKPIRIVAQEDVTDEQLLGAYGILSFYLTPVPGSAFGADKTDVANHIANSRQIINMPNGGDGSQPEEIVTGQPLYAREFPMEGTRAYLENDWDQRNAGFEEILHFVHDFGIGTVNGEGALKPAYQSQIFDATENALAKKLWGHDSAETREWINDLREEGSLEQEYLAALIDSYYGLWGAWQETPGGMWGIYVAKTREDIARKDPQGYALIDKFFPQYLTYMARIDAGFSGTFLMHRDPKHAYTHKSQYLLKARLTGSKNANLVGNDADNVMMGNGGKNILDGLAGNDVVQFSGPRANYEIDMDNKDVVVTDTTGVDGTNVLRNIEILRFRDADVAAHDIQT